MSSEYSVTDALADVMRQYISAIDHDAEITESNIGSALITGIILASEIMVVTENITPRALIEAATDLADEFDYKPCEIQTVIESDDDDNENL